MKTYTNPIYPEYFADPFVLEHLGLYYAYGTAAGALANGRVIEVLCSSDLVHWRSLGGALEPLTDLERYPEYWAPEVAYDQGLFYLYYSSGQDTTHRLRVAVSSTPEGPFQDQGLELAPHLTFSIDAHPFQDVDGQWYLFYARDFMEGDRPGTALEVDRLSSMTQLAGDPRPVLRASQDWQIYQHQRELYGTTLDWHTLEGAFVLHRQGRYYLLYSGGAWQQPHYGVSYAVAYHPLGPWSEPDSDGPSLLRTVPGKVLGPGHNSVVVGPDQLDYLIYHAWDSARTARRMCMDRLEWTAQGPRTTGPTFTPQPIPAME